MTATPKETKEISNIDYFGDPIYTYSLRQGINDGFLAPYKVVRIDIDKDLTGWRPDKFWQNKRLRLIRSVGIKNAHDLRVETVKPVIGHRHRFGESLRLVVDPAGSDGVHVAPVGLGLGMNHWIPVYL